VGVASQHRAACIAAAVWASHRRIEQRASQPPCRRRIAASSSVHRSRRVGGASQQRAACISAAVRLRLEPICGSRCQTLIS